MLWQTALPVEVFVAWNSAAVPDMLTEHALNGPEPTCNLNLSKNENAAAAAGSTVTQLLVCLCAPANRLSKK
jgi:hypothetical protein